ncbi:hypothetical protein [Ignavibacterium album]|uniref:hypothetical protein n=1 Tax=Ignavibacterium album TaxID=591197 RepID=UPI0026EC19E9|nr:hypothetical protein [Ignavibacterium album]
MKIAIIISSIFFCSISLAQTYQWCIDSLYSENYNTKLLAIDCVNYFKPEGAIDVLVDLIEEQQPYLQIQFLNALYTLNYDDVITKAHELISRADDFENDPEYPWDPLDAKVFATAILVYKGDYSTIEYVFDQLNGNEITYNNIIAFHLLPDIMANMPNYKDEAKNILLNELDNENVDIRYYALLYLAQEFGEEMNNELRNKLINDNDLPTKIMALEYLFINNYSELNSLLKQQLELEEEPSLRINIADSLLQKFGEPSDLKAVIDYQPNEPDETARSLMRYSIKEFIPPKPDTLGYYDLCIRLISYTEEMFEYNWILNKETRDYYAERLTEIYQSIENTGEISYACSIINERILPQVERDRAEELITSEGYKFLYYYTTYKKEEIEEEYGSCP